MNFIVSATTDTGLVKEVNQDSYDVRVLSTPQEKMVFAVLCDGMGGLSNGEVASASLVNAYVKWVENVLPNLVVKELTDEDIRNDWINIAKDLNEKIQLYGKKIGSSAGTTLTAVLLTEKRYYIINVGDTRAYEISDTVTVLTKDQTLVAREVEAGNLTPREAETDSRRNILLQCVGASGNVYPEMFFGDTKLNAVYMLCSDGFRHEISTDEIYSYLNPNVMLNAEGMKQNMDTLVEINKQRQEKDNITVVSIRTF